MTAPKNIDKEERGFMKKILKATGFTALMAIIYLLVSVIVGIAIGVLLMIKAMVSNTAIDMNNMTDMITEGLSDWMIVMVITINVVTLLIVFLIFLARKDKFFSYIQLKKFKPSDAIWIGVLGFFFNILIVGLVTLSSDILPIQDKMEQYQALMEPLMNGPFLLVFAVVSLSAPLFEETIFRGIILNDFKKAVPVWVAIIIQGVLFGVFHMNWIQGVYASVLGIVLGIICLKYNSIWAPIIMHFTYNSTSFLLDYVFKENTNVFIVIAVGIIGSVLISLVLIKSYDCEYYDKQEVPVENIIEDALKMNETTPENCIFEEVDEQI